MKLTYLLLLCMTLTAVLAEGKSNKKDLAQEERQEEAMLNAREGGIEMDDDDEYESVDIRQKEPVDVVVGRFQHPCREKKCKRGEVCVLQDRSALCVCQTCSPREDGEQEIKACTTDNVTYDSECELDRQHCLCKHSQPGCTSNAKKIRLDYYGACKEMETCPEIEFEQFGARMKDWLFRVMREMANRSELDEYLDLLESATNDENHVDAVLWKFCDLDVDPEDRKVTRRELMYIVASIKPMERCLVPFLNHCDTDDDHTISLVEWGTCLKIGHESITDKCHHVHQRRG